MHDSWEQNLHHVIRKNKQIVGIQSNCALCPTGLAVIHLLVFSNAIDSTRLSALK